MEYEHDPSGKIPGPKDADGDPEYMMSHNADHDDWHKDLSKEDKAHYLKLHPDSKYSKVNAKKSLTDEYGTVKNVGQVIGDLSKSTALGVDEIKVDQWGIPIHCGDAIEVHDGDKAMLKELIQAGVVDPEHEMDKRVPQVVNRVFGGVY
jgi:hypothetical protein